MLLASLSRREIYKLQGRHIFITVPPRFTNNPTGVSGFGQH